MRLPLAVAVLALLPIEAHAADVKGTSRIESVTVFPSGAEITRVGKVKLERGDHTVLFADLPARAIPSSIRVEGKATGKLEIGSVDSRRVFVPRSDNALTLNERKRVEDAIEKLKDDRAVLQTSIEAAEAQKVLVKNLAQLPTQPPPAGGSAAAGQPDWSQLFALIGQRSVEAQKAILDAQVKIRDVDRQIKDLEGKLTSLAPAQEDRTELKVFVSAGASLDADIVISYQIANASWVPFYDARLVTGTKAQPPKLQLIRRASIQQRTGESWDDVSLSLSTARPSAGTTAPELSPVTVDYEADAPARPAPVAGAPRSLTAPAQGRVTAMDEDRAKARSDSVAAEETRASIETQAFQAIYGIAGRVTVQTTGEPKRVLIDDMVLDPALTVRTVPKRDQKAYLYAKITIARGATLLPGQVSLFRDTVFVGRGHMPLLAAGEDYELGFGVNDLVRVRHTIAEEKRSESGIITASKTDIRNYRIVIKNLHERSIQLTVLDQIPVSQNADIRIELLGKTSPTKRDVDDKRGVLAWEMKLEPDEERSFEFGYRVTWPAAKKIIYGN